MPRFIVMGTLLAILMTPLCQRPAELWAAPSAQGGTTHVVRPGETLSAIARTYRVTVEAIARANNILNPDCIYAGQKLVIPGAGPAAPSPTGGACHYVVQPGDTLSKIAARYGTTVGAIMAANGLRNADYIYAGQQLVIPQCQVAPPPAPVPPPPPPPVPCGQVYVVQPGDTLSRIALRHHTTVQALATANGLRYPYVIYPGQRLVVPCPSVPPAPKPKPTPTPALKPAACARQVQIVRPLEGQHVSGVVQIIGTASIDNFQFYKLEYAIGHLPLDNSAFKSINEIYTTPVVDTVLGTWYVGNMPSGPYTLRLTAVDKRGQFPRPCEVHIFIDN